MTPELRYLTAEEAHDRLVAAGESPPDIPALAIVLEAIEIEVEDWLGWSLPVQLYTEIIQCSEAGTVLMTHYPVIEVINVDRVRDHYVEVDETPVARFDIRSTWRHGQVLHVGQYFNIDTPVEVTYRAGLEPLPRIVKITFMTLLRAALETSGTTGDLSFLHEPTKDTTSLSLPGGMSTGWQVGKPNTGIEGLGESQLDRLLKPLSKYRRRFTL